MVTLRATLIAALLLVPVVGHAWSEADTRRQVAYTALAFLLALSGCASTSGTTQHSVEPQSVEVRFLSESEWVDFTTERMFAGDTWATPDNILGMARTSGDECVLYFPAENPPTKETIVHELRHCSEGSFHK